METAPLPVKVLVIDDEEGIRMGASRILARMDCEVATASRGEEALELIDRQPFSIVL